MEVGRRGWKRRESDDVKTRGEVGEGKGRREKRAPEETQEERDGETEEGWQKGWREGGAYCPETTAEREKE